jgi:hypothetical protein
MPTMGNSNISNIEKIEHFQSKVLRIIVNAPWFVLGYSERPPNTTRERRNQELQ